MELTIGDGITIEAPSLEQVREALSDLNGGPDSFVILDSKQGPFIQAHGSATSGFLLEHHAAGGTHRRAANTSLALSTVVRAFERFTSGATDPLKGLASDKVEDEAPSETRKRPFLPIWAVLILIPVVLGGVMLLVVSGMASGRLSVRAVCVGAALVVSGLLWEGVRNGHMNGYRRDSQPGSYYFYLALYIFQIATATIAAIVL